MGFCALGIIGDCNSTTTTDISDITNNNTDINNSITNMIKQDCNMDTIQSNTINIIGSTVKKLTAKQNNSIQSSCIMQSVLKSTTDATVVNNLLSKIKTNLETKGAIFGSPATNNTIVKNLTNNNTKIDNSTFNNISKNCILNTTQKNLLNIIGSNVEDTTTDQYNSAFLKCLSQHSSDTGIKASDLSDTKEDTDNKSKTTGGDLPGSVGDAISKIVKSVGGIFDTYIYAIVGVVVCCLLFCIVSSFFAFQGPSTPAAPSASGIDTGTSTGIDTGTSTGTNYGMENDLAPPGYTN